MSTENRCGKEGYSCEKCMKLGSMFIDCCIQECGNHEYCKYCTRRDSYILKKVDSNND